MPDSAKALYDAVCIALDGSAELTKDDGTVVPWTQSNVSKHFQIDGLAMGDYQIDYPGRVGFVDLNRLRRICGQMLRLRQSLEEMIEFADEPGATWCTNQIADYQDSLIRWLTGAHPGNHDW